MGILGKIKFLQSLLQGTKTNKKIVVIESDDWGSERIPNINVREQLSKSGIDVKTNPHSRFDTLERLEDLEVLEDFLNYFEINYGKKVRITANFITANPDYSKIERDNFRNFYYESFTETYRQRDGHTQVIDKMKKLVSSGKIMPQFHGREHINAEFWLEALRDKNESFLKAFELKCFGIDASSKGRHRKNLMAAFEYENDIQKKLVINSIKDGMHQFEEVFGFRSTSIIAPRYIWKTELENTFQTEGVEHIQTSFYQKEPIEYGYENKFHFTGQSSKVSGLNYLVRNAYFEPAYQGNVDWVNGTLRNVTRAFQFRTPAIISMHRINFVGGLDPQVREINMNKFRALLVKIIEEYPEVEFITSNELGNLIKGNYVRN